MVLQAVRRAEIHAFSLTFMEDQPLVGNRLGE
jgi:hypothetical protein